MNKAGFPLCARLPSLTFLPAFNFLEHGHTYDNVQSWTPREPSAICLAKGLCVLTRTDWKWTGGEGSPLEHLHKCDRALNCESISYPFVFPLHRGLHYHLQISHAPGHSIVSFWHTFPERCQCPQLCNLVQCSCPSARALLRGGRPCPPRSPRCPGACWGWAAPRWSRTCRWTGNQELCVERGEQNWDWQIERETQERWTRTAGDGWKRSWGESTDTDFRREFILLRMLMQKEIVYSPF